MGVETINTSENAESPNSRVHSTPTHDDATFEQHGSSIPAAIFNFTNCIIGAGAIGLGGAFSASGGLISIVSLLGFGILTKISLDMVIQLSVEHAGQNASYEELALLSYGRIGWASVIMSKTLYSFGCLVAYIIVVKDNFATALLHLLVKDPSSESASMIVRVTQHDDTVTWALSICVIFPLCLLRDMTSLSSLSMISVVSMVFIVVIVVYLFVMNPNGEIRQAPGGNMYQEWLVIRPGFVESLGTFVFTFVSQHTVHLAYESLRPDIRSVKSWKIVSTWSIAISSTVSLLIGLFVYLTFWEHAQSDLFELYPPIAAIDISKLLLCVSMLLTFPLPFFTCRDMIVLCLESVTEGTRTNGRGVSADENCTSTETSATEQLQEPLLEQHEADGHSFHTAASHEPVPSHSFTWLLPGQEDMRQLKLPYHIAITFLLWTTTTFLAIVSPSLGDVLDLVGCATGTVIAFVLPSLFYFRLVGYSHTAALVLLVGGVVGSLGTYQSVGKLIADA